MIDFLSDFDLELNLPEEPIIFKIRYGHITSKHVERLFSFLDIFNHDCAIIQNVFHNSVYPHFVFYLFNKIVCI